MKDLLYIEDVNIANYEGHHIAINHIIFGKKFIYLISDFLLKGFVTGDENNNSWIYYDTKQKKHLYLDNLNILAEKNIKDFAGILQISSDPIVNICVVPNECDFKILNEKNNNTVITRYSFLKRAIKRFEKREIGFLNPDQILDEFKLIKSKNEEGNK